MNIITVNLHNSPENGFETMVNKVADIEKQLGIYDLSLNLHQKCNA